jgi:signal transduction histidine kinase
VEHSERILLRADGGSAHILKSAKRFTFNGVEKLLETFVDISGRKEAEAMRDHIERIIRHDLRAPVSSALYTAQLLRDGENLTADQRSMLDMLSTAAKQMLDTLNSSLELYTIEAGQYKASNETLDCADIIRALGKTLLETKKFAGVGIAVLNAGRPAAEDFRCPCRGEEHLFRTAMQNVLLNALEASPAGAMVTVDLSLGDKCRIEVSNKGVVPPEIRDRFFDKYVTSGKYKGTGLGTYSAKMMLRAQGGDISMRTSDSDGATVVTLSLLRAEQGASV